MELVTLCPKRPSKLFRSLISFLECFAVDFSRKFHCRRGHRRSLDWPNRRREVERFPSVIVGCFDLLPASLHVAAIVWASAVVTWIPPSPPSFGLPLPLHCSPYYRYDWSDSLGRRSVTPSTSLIVAAVVDSTIAAALTVLVVRNYFSFKKK